MLQHKLKDSLKKVGVHRYFRYSEHSLRRGGLAYGYKIGLSTKYLKSLGDWKSDCFEVYLSFPREIRDTAARKLRDSLII